MIHILHSFLFIPVTSLRPAVRIFFSVYQYNFLNFRLLFILMVEAEYSFERLEAICWITRRHIPKDAILNFKDGSVPPTIRYIQAKKNLSWEK
jgi:hypothetical protein